MSRTPSPSPIVTAFSFFSTVAALWLRLPLARVKLLANTPLCTPFAGWRVSSAEVGAAVVVTLLGLGSGLSSVNVLAAEAPLSQPLSQPPSQPPSQKAQAAEQPAPGELTALIELALDYGHRSIEERRQAIDRGYSLLERSAGDLVWERGGLDLAFGYLRYESGEVDLAIETLRSSISRLSEAAQPELYIRTSTLLAGLLTASGRTADGLAMLETLLAADFPSAQAHRVEYARANYATSLMEAGRMEEASSAYEQSLLYAQSTGDVVLSLAAGSNYVSLLKNQGLSAEAEYWLYQLKPVMAQLPSAQGTAKLELFEFCLNLGAGKVDQVLRELEGFMARPQQHPEAIVSEAEVLYADALRAAGRFEDSLRAARRAFALQAEFPLDQLDARVAIVRSLMALQDYSTAGDELADLEAAGVTEPSMMATLRQLQLEHALRTNDTDRAELAFNQYKRTNATLKSFINSRQADYYGERLRTQRAEHELKLVRDAQALFAAEVAAQKAQASELRMREQAQEELRNMQIAGMLVLSLAAIGMVVLSARNRLQKRLKEELSSRNASLSALVDAKSKDLVEQVMERAVLKQALAERRHMEAIGQIAGHVAHDFNNTLQVVSSANELLEPLVSSESHKKVLGASNRSIRSGSSTVKQLLAYSRNQQLESSVFSIDKFLNDNAALFRSAIGEVNTLSIENHVNDAKVKLDSGQLTGSLINLLRNSVDAMSEPGKVVLRCVGGVRLIGDDDQLRPVPQVKLQVIDTGRGMSAEEADHALEPYYTTKPAELGTGLGLSSVYGFVVQSGGSISVDSKVGEGTTVSLSFPEHDGVVSEEPTVKGAESVLRNTRVLLVEDNALIAETLQEMLIQEGAETAWVDSADAAQDELKKGVPFDIMLSDINIRGALNGFDLARWVKNIYPKIQIGMMSGYGPALAEDFDVPILAKPFTRQQLLAYLMERIWLLKP